MQLFYAQPKPIRRDPSDLPVLVVRQKVVIYEFQPYAT
jgi:hypothetical protein